MSKLEKVFDTPNKKAFIGFLTGRRPGCGQHRKIHFRDGKGRG